MVRTTGRSRRCVATAMAAAAIAAAAGATTAHAQSSANGRDAARVPGVLLLVRPRVGDTLRLQMEQTIEVSSRPANAATRQGPPVLDGTRTQPARTSSPEYGPRRSRTSMRITRLVLFAHSLVEASDLSVTTLLATTDSMAMWAGSPGETGEPLSLIHI